RDCSCPANAFFTRRTRDSAADSSTRTTRIRSRCGLCDPDRGYGTFRNHGRVLRELVANDEASDREHRHLRLPATDDLLLAHALSRTRDRRNASLWIASHYFPESDSLTKPHALACAGDCPIVCRNGNGICLGTDRRRSPLLA